MAEELLTMEQVDTVIEFANALYTIERYGGMLSPIESNRLLRGLQGGKKAPTFDAVKVALAECRNSPAEVNSYMEFMKSYDMIFAKTLKQYVNVLAFDLIPICKNAFTEEDYKSAEYESDKRRLYDFLDKFNYKEEFRKVTEHVFQNEVYYTWFRRTRSRGNGIKYALQILPQNMCMMTGYWEKGILFDFDMNYFNNAGVDIDGFAPVFKQYYNRAFKIKDYKPSAQLRNRKGAYGQWIQTSPSDGAWCFKFDPSDFNAVPFIAPLLKSAIRNDELQELQRNKDIAAAYAIIAGTIGTFDSAKSGTKYDQLKFNPKTLGGFMAKAKQGLSDTIKLAALPVDNIKLLQYEDTNSGLETNQLEATSATGSFVSNPLYATEKMSIAEVEAGLTTMYQTMRHLYAQFENFLEFQANAITKKYKWKFKMDGSTINSFRQKQVDNIFRLADKGIVLPMSVWSSCLGYAPQDFERLMQESKSTGWIDDYCQLLMNANIGLAASSSSTTKDSSGGGYGTDNGGGRKVKDDGDIAESTESSRESRQI